LPDVFGYGARLAAERRAGGVVGFGQEVHSFCGQAQK
jgi:hypothetical protein